VAFNPVKENVIATGSWDSAIRMWDIFHRERIAVSDWDIIASVLQKLFQVLRGHSTSVRDVAFSPCGSYVASAALDGEVKLWSANHGTPVSRFTLYHI
jgi:telomerase protein component 1